MAWWKNLRWSRHLDTDENNIKYEALLGQPDRPSDEIDPRHLPITSRTRPIGSLGWIISTVIFGTTTLILLVKLVNTTPASCDPTGQGITGFGTFEKGFHTEMKTALDGLPLDVEGWSGHLVYNATSGLWNMEYPPHEPRWVEEPNPTIDARWEVMERAKILYLQGEEADFVREGTTWVNGYWVTGVDVFHQLHCLNSVRKALWPEYYHVDRSNPSQRMHINHCLDYIRQALMCWGDATPIRRKYFPEAGVFGPDLTVKHTCRDIDSMVKWALARSVMDGPGSEVPLDQSWVVTDERPFVDGGEPVHKKMT